MTILGFALVGAAIGLAAPSNNYPLLLICINIGIVGGLLIRCGR